MCGARGLKPLGGAGGAGGAQGEPGREGEGRRRAGEGKFGLNFQGDGTIGWA